MATFITKDSSENLKVEVEPNEAQTYLPNEYEPTQTELETMADDISDLETAVSNLETAVEAFPMIEAGTTETTVSVASNSYEDVEISFTKNFSSIPLVFTSLTGSGDTSYRGAMSATVKLTTKTAVTIRIYNNSAAALTVGLNWLAIS